MNNHISQYGDIVLTTNDGQFQLLIGFIFYNARKPRIVIHTHNYHELFYIAQGQLDVVFPDHTVTVPENAMFQIPPNTPHYTNKESSPSQVFILSYQYTPPLEETTADSSFLPSLVPIVSAYSHEIQDAFMRLSRYINAELKSKNELISACFYEILYLLKSTSDEKQDKQPISVHHNMNREYLIYMINEYINQYFTTGITLSDLADLVHLSVRHTNRIIQETYGQTFRQKIMDMRIRSAVNLLLETDMTVKGIAHKVGYKAVNSFYEAFDRYHHMTPEQYRKLHTNTDK